MSVKVTTKTVTRWRCQAPDCPRQGRRWTARKEKRPQVCPTCHSHRWDGVDRRRRVVAKPGSGVPTDRSKSVGLSAAQEPEKILLTFYRCTCELPDCPGKGKPWETRVEPKHGSHCKWCHRTSWNGVDRRRKGWRQPSLPAPDFAIQPERSGVPADRSTSAGWLIAEQNSGQAGAKTPGQQTDAIATSGGRVTIARPAGTGHALGCKCTVCQMQTGEIVRGPRRQVHVGGVVELPKPDKVRSIE